MSARLLVMVAIVAAGLLGWSGAPAAAAGRPPPCDRGELCLWSGEEFRGTVLRLSLVNANPGECVPLASGFDARSFANRASRQVTVYQDRWCSTEGEFDTYPGGGTYVPEAPYLVRAVQIWERRR